MTKNKRYELRISEQDLKELRAFADKTKVSLSELITSAALNHVRTGASDVRTKKVNKVDNVRTAPKPAQKQKEPKASVRPWQPYDKKTAAK